MEMPYVDFSNICRVYFNILHFLVTSNLFLKLHRKQAALTIHLSLHQLIQRL